MPTWAYTILLTVITTVVTGVVITPRIEAYNAPRQIAREARRKFGKSVLTILSACGRLRGFEPSEDMTETMRLAVAEERRRWLAQTDDATRFLADELESYALSYLGAAKVRDRVMAYAATVRGLYISDRPEAEKIEIIGRLTSPIHGIYFASFWWRAFHLVEQVREFDRVLSEINGTAGQAAETAGHGVDA